MKWNTRIASFTINDLEVDVKENPLIESGKNRLLENFPNPFSKTTTIQWLLAEPVNVKVQILDLTGKTLVKLLDANQRAGKHKIEFDASCLNAGVYICQFTAGRIMDTQKLILIK
jgi:hypothetical protein